MRVACCVFVYRGSAQVPKRLYKADTASGRSIKFRCKQYGEFDIRGIIIIGLTGVIQSK